MVGLIAGMTGGAAVALAVLAALEWVHAQPERNRLLALRTSTPAQSRRPLRFMLLFPSESTALASGDPVRACGFDYTIDPIRWPSGHQWADAHVELPLSFWAVRRARRRLRRAVRAHGGLAWSELELGALADRDLDRAT